MDRGDCALPARPKFSKTQIISMSKLKTMIVGTGQSGLSVARFLQGIDSVTLTDTNSSQESSKTHEIEDLKAKYLPGDNALEEIACFDRLILSPGVPLASPLVKKAFEYGIPMMGEIEFAFRECKQRYPQNKILAITGTNGKSTTTDLLSVLIREGGGDAIPCGNIGFPFTDALKQANQNTVFCLEVSSYQLETVSRFKADVAAFLNLAPDHLERHETIEKYRDIKLRIFENQNLGDIRISPYNEPQLCRFDKTGPLNLFFSLNPMDALGCFVDNEGNIRIKLMGGDSEVILNKNKLLILGQHNIANVLVACLMAAVIGIKIPSIQRSLENYKGLRHRLSLFAQHNGIRFINDSKATNVDSTSVALRAVNGPIILLLGGIHKGSSYTPLIPLIKDKVSHLIFIGEAIPILENDLGLFPHDSIYDFSEGVKRGLDIAKKGTTLLLSPACASFDQFTNFEARGDAFERLVNNWISSKT